MATHAHELSHTHMWLHLQQHLASSVSFEVRKLRNHATSRSCSISRLCWEHAAAPRGARKAELTACCTECRFRCRRCALGAAKSACCGSSLPCARKTSPRCTCPCCFFFLKSAATSRCSFSASNRWTSPPRLISLCFLAITAILFQCQSGAATPLRTSYSPAPLTLASACFQTS